MKRTTAACVALVLGIGGAVMGFYAHSEREKVISENAAFEERMRALERNTTFKLVDPEGVQAKQAYEDRKNWQGTVTFLMYAGAAFAGASVVFLIIFGAIILAAGPGSGTGPGR